MKYNSKAKMKEAGEERTKSQEKITHELAKFKKGIEEKKKSFRNEDSLEKAQRRIDVEKNTVSDLGNKEEKK